MIEYNKYKCDRCQSENTKLETWEDEYSKKTLFTCLNCSYITGSNIQKKKAKEVLL